MRTRIAPVVVVLLLVVAAVVAQSQRGEITGVVREVSGSVLPGVTVQARGPEPIQSVESAASPRPDWRPGGADYRGRCGSAQSRLLIDVSGSMMPADKLPLLRQAMRIWSTC